MDKNTVNTPTEFNYVDKYQKRKIELIQKPDEMVVTISQSVEGNSEETETAVRSASKSKSLIGLFRVNIERRVAVVKVDESTDSLDVASSDTPPEFQNTIPAFIDTDGLTRYFVPDEVTVQFKTDLTEQKAESHILSIGSHIVVNQRTPLYYTIAVPAGSNVFETINKLNSMSDVLFAEPSEIGFDDAQASSPNDSRFDELWGLENKGQAIEGLNGTPGADIDALDAWKTTTGDRDVIVVVIDTGMDLDHEDLNENLVSRGTEDWDFASTDGSPDDAGSHGTHVCGTAAAQYNNKVGIAGVAPNCRLIPLRINLSAGMNANRADAINFASSKAVTNAKQRFIINCSWRASGNFSAILFAIDTAVARGTLVIFAAGNAGKDMDIQSPQFPGVHPNAICVAALNANDKRAGFSNIGSQVDVSAPGVSILSTIPNNNYDFFNGTSMAAPHVAGVCALIWSANKSLSNLQVRQILQDNCDDISEQNPTLSGKLGRGRVNAAKAVASANIAFT